MSRKPIRTRPDVSEALVLPTEHPEEVTPTARVIDEIRETADKLERDGATLGDLKIISRAMKELRYAFKVFTPYRRRRKVTVFGSARMLPEHPAYQHAIQFGERMAEQGWFVVTGAGGGIMEAAHVGAGREMSMGLNIMLPFEQDANYVIDGDNKLVHLKYFFTRKLLFVKEVHAIVVYPGGFGTQDECFETLTLVQTGKRDLMPIVLIDSPDGSYWQDWLDYTKDNLLSEGLISPEDLSLFKVTTEVDEATDEILHFYTVYNSMRFVKGRLVIRLHREPDDQLMERLNDEFASMLDGGRIDRVPPHPLEMDDEHLRELPRIALNFNRRDIGRLRQMVDLLNDELDEEPGEPMERNPERAIDATSDSADT